MPAADQEDPPVYQDSEIKTAVALLSGLAEGTRMKIVGLLTGAGPASVTAISEGVGVEMVNASHHLSVLLASGLVTKSRDGRQMIYAMNPDVYDNGTLTAGPWTVTLGKKK